MTPASSHILGSRITAQNTCVIMSVKQVGVPMGSMLAGLALPYLVHHLGWQPRSSHIPGHRIGVELQGCLRPPRNRSRAGGRCAFSYSSVHYNCKGRRLGAGTQLAACRRVKSPGRCSNAKVNDLLSLYVETGCEFSVGGPMVNHAIRSSRPRTADPVNTTPSCLLAYYALIRQHVRWVVLVFLARSVSPSHRDSPATSCHCNIRRAGPCPPNRYCLICEASHAGH